MKKIENKSVKETDLRREKMWSFPDLGVSVSAKSYEEALAKVEAMK